MKWAYTAIVLPRLLYGCHIWGRLATHSKVKTNLRRLNRLACLSITSAFPHTPTATLEIICQPSPLHLNTLASGFSKFLRARHGHTSSWDGKGKGTKLGFEKWWEANLLPRLPAWVNDIPPPHTSRIIDHSYSIILDRTACPPDPLDLDVFTDGSKSDSVGNGVQIYDQGKAEVNGCFRIPDHCSVYQAKMDAIRLAASHLLSKGTTDRTINFYLDSFSSLSTLQRNRFRTILESDTCTLLNKLAEHKTSRSYG